MIKNGLKNRHPGNHPWARLIIKTKLGFKRLPGCGTGKFPKMERYKKAAHTGGFWKVKKLPVYCLVSVVVLVPVTPPELPVKVSTRAVPLKLLMFTVSPSCMR